MPKPEHNDWRSSWHRLRHWSTIEIGSVEQLPTGYQLLRIEAPDSVVVAEIAGGRGADRLAGKSGVDARRRAQQPKRTDSSAGASSIKRMCVEYYPVMTGRLAP
jgi:hypothetical protein